MQIIQFGKKGLWIIYMQFVLFNAAPQVDGNKEASSARRRKAWWERNSLICSIWPLWLIAIICGVIVYPPYLCWSCGISFQKVIVNADYYLSRNGMAYLPVWSQPVSPIQWWEQMHPNLSVYRFVCVHLSPSFPYSWTVSSAMTGLSGYGRCPGVMWPPSLTLTPPTLYPMTRHVRYHRWRLWKGCLWCSTLVVVNCALPWNSQYPSN